MLDRHDSIGLLHRQTEVMGLIAAGEPLAGVLRAIALALEAVMAGSRCSILLLDAAGRSLHHGAAPTLPVAYSRAIDGLVIGPDAGSCGTAAYLGAPVVAEDVRHDPRWVRFRHAAQSHGLRSCWSTPICGRAGTVGTFAVYHLEPHRPSPRERGLVEQFTHLASVAIDHDGLFGALAESEERFRRAFEDNAVGMALTDLDGRLTKVNRALQEMLDRTDLLETSLSDLLDGGPRPPFDAAVHFEADARRPDGAVVRVAVAASVVRNADGEPVRLSVNLLDVTQRRAAERERRARREAELARAAAEAANRAKSSFVTALSHELRTPLQAITGFAELLGGLDLTPERRRAALGHIDSATAHILSLVDDVLDLAKVEAGAMPIRLDDVDVAALVVEVLELLEPIARTVTLVHAVPAVTVRADRRRLRQVLLNLVGNGIRYNVVDGRVDVTAERAGPCVRVCVMDTGPGIPLEVRDRLFVPFDRLGAESGPEPGAGLGLVLARSLTEAMGGRLDLRSTVGRGTTATISLPAG